MSIKYGQKLWVHLSPALKKEIRTPSVSVPFDTDGFLQGLQDHATYTTDGANTGIDKDYLRQQHRYSEPVTIC